MLGAIILIKRGKKVSKAVVKKKVELWIKEFLISLLSAYLYFIDLDLKELEKEKEENLKDRLDFIEKYANWVKKTENEKWSKQQKEIIL